MRYVLWTLTALLVLIVGGFLSWTLPSHEIVRILGTEIARRNVETTNERGEQLTLSRDVRYIKAVTADGETRVYRNEDTGWWPPYFKFDSADLAARADDAISTAASPRWFVVSSYGWRFSFLSKFPNALSIRPATGPDERLIPWFNIIVLVVLLGLALLAAHKVRQRFAD